MLKFLASREAGLLSPHRLEKAECTRRAFSLELSKYYDVQRIHDAAINTLDIDPVEDRYLLSGASNGTTVIHDLHCTAGIPQYTHPDVSHVGRGNVHRHKYSVETVQWYPLDTGMFVSSGMDKLLKVWDTNTMKTADEFQFGGGVYCHHMSLVATQHCLIAVASHSNKVKLVDLKTGSATHVLRAHRQPVITVQWSPSEEFLLATGSQDSRVILWDIRSAKGPLMMLDQHNGDTTAASNSVNTAHDGLVNAVQFTPDGLHLLTFGSDDHIRLWRTSSGKNTMVNYGRINNECRKSIKLAVCNISKPELVFIPDASEISAYDIFSGMKMMSLQGHYNQVNSCVFHESMQDLYSCGSDRNILVWKPYLETTQAYEEYMRQGDSERGRTDSGYVRQIGAADTWSDED